ncbi:MAG: hypothetical protein VYE73_04010, partial [Acidobacteriota bacterium]|nr:hypothetical protein [Acidobacteriota bacterium]
VGDEVFITESYGPGASLVRVTRAGHELVWRDPPGRVRSISSHWSTPVVHEGHLYGSSGEKTGAAELRCVEWATGKVRWQQPGLARTTQLYVDGHIVVFTEYGELLLIEADPAAFHLVARATPVDERGRKLLSYPAWSPPALADGVLYLLGGNRLAAFRVIP